MPRSRLGIFCIGRYEILIHILNSCAETAGDVSAAKYDIIAGEDEMATKGCDESVININRRFGIYVYRTEVKEV